MPDSGNFKRIMWIELYGFDLRDADLGVKRLFTTAGFTPEKIMLFIWNPDFIHTHRANQDPDEIMRPDYGAYYGRPYGEDFSRQQWRFGDLKRLIKEIQKYGTKVFLSVLDQIMIPSYADLFELKNVEHQWTDNHQEILYVHINGERIPCICPWKRFKDGAYYEDFFLKQLRSVLTDYNFDGFHGADGYGHPRFSIFSGDLSNDVIEQYGTHPDLPPIDETDASQIKARAETLWKNHRESWSRFWCERRRDFWRKITDALHQDRREVILNTCWTRDPLEAVYRHGLDYRILQDVGIDGWIVEAPASVATAQNLQVDGCDELYKNSIMLANIRAQLPEAKLYLLNALKDTMEQYCSIRNTPALVESDIYGFAGVDYYDSQGCCHRALDGVLSCLSDGLSPHEWEFWRYRWEVAAAEPLAGGAEIAAVYSPAAAAAELKAYFKQPFTSSYRWLFSLLNIGAPIAGRIDINGIKHHNGPVLVVHPVFFSTKELDKIKKSAQGKVFFAGLTEAAPLGGQPPFLENSWQEELPEPQPAQDKTRYLAEAMRRAVEAPEVISGKCHVFLKYHPDNRKILTIRNDSQYYQTCKIAFSYRISQVTALNQYLRPVKPEQYKDGSLISIFIPSYAVMVFEIA